MNRVRVAGALLLALMAWPLAGQGLDPAKLLAQPTDAWPTYNGDYSGRRFSPLTHLNSSNVTAMTLAWEYRLDPGSGILTSAIKATPLEVNGVLYFTLPDHAWAIDARTGRQIWHYEWHSKGGIHIGSRGFGMYGNWLYFETPDDYLVSLNAKDGIERWHVQIADVNQEYFATPAPIVIRDHILVGVGGDSLDVPGYLESRDPETGQLQWRWNTTPRKGEPGAETWPNPEAMAHGGGMTWVPGTYDPELNLYYLGTGNPNPVLAGQGRKGSNLWTCSIVALNPDTGKMVWYFQASPHDTHDWDAAETPVLIDGTVDGQPRKLLAQSSRNGYFFLLDRTNGQNILSKPFVNINWSEGVDAKGQPIGNPAKEPKPNGTLVMPAEGGAANWPSPSFDPQTGLFYVNAVSGYSVDYLTDTSDKPEGFAGRDMGVYSTMALKAIEYQTGRVRWKHEYHRGGGSIGILTTAGNLLFTGDPSGNFIVYDAGNGKILWHAHLVNTVSNAPMTYELDGRQYVVVGAGDTVYGFTLLQ